MGVYVAGCGLFHPGPLDVSPVELRRRYKGEGSGRVSSSSGTLRLCLAAARSIRSTHCNASTIQPYSVDWFPWTRAGRQHSLAQPPSWKVQSAFYRFGKIGITFVHILLACVLPAACAYLSFIFYIGSLGQENVVSLSPCSAGRTTGPSRYVN